MGCGSSKLKRRRNSCTEISDHAFDDNLINDNLVNDNAVNDNTVNNKTTGISYYYDNPVNDNPISDSPVCNKTDGSKIKGDVSNIKTDGNKVKGDVSNIKTDSKIIKANDCQPRPGILDKVYSSYRARKSSGFKDPKLEHHREECVQLKNKLRPVGDPEKNRKKKMNDIVEKQKKKATGPLGLNENELQSKIKNLKKVK
eukprot:CAMPEP_0197826556 /NCGR_PEP_ID=MMETSP1437-20131217/3502_1 /TAXON_ID=49252 ORGANISM="Eucampia antarctica, Strain CCMP1452" /NCGR_SAMPLE_ID=MMETSP1437 /ASSEMBLY_ACC=CAM_ASM_001096 /LENGTH=198 /DNA_ID=CAMNT_0043427039 /DNA_START=89 /DNA_END=685 /DNA_ORIENTATION=+